MRREDGATLVELLLSTTISGVVLAALLMVVLTGFRSFQAASDSLGQSESVALLRLNINDDARSAYPDPALTFVSSDSSSALLGTCDPASASANTLTLGLYDQANGFSTVVYKYVPATGEITRAVADGAAPLGAARVVGKKLAKCYVASGANPPVFTISGVVVSANIPLPGDTTPLKTVKVVMRSQAP